MIKKDSNESNLYTEKWFTNRDILGGKKTKKMFLNILKLKNTYALKKIVWKKKYFLIFLNNPKKTILLKKYNIQEMDAYNSYHLKIISGEAVILCKEKWKKSTSYLLKNLRESLKNIPFEKILETIFMDEGSIIRTSDGIISKNNLDLKNYSSYFSSWGSKESKLWFIAPDIIKKYTLPSYLDLKYKEDLQIVQHGDFECLKMGGELDSSNNLEFIHFVDIPRPINYEYNSIKRLKKRDIAATLGFIENMNNSVLYDKEIIFGGMENLKKIVRKIHKTHPNSDILMMSSCTPFIIGDDLPLIYKEISKKIKTKIMYKDVVRTNLYEDYFKEISALINKGSPQKKYRTVNLVGFLKNNFFFEILDILKILEIGLNQSCLPGIHKENFLNYKSAEIQILFPNYNYEWIYKQFFRKIDLPTISPDQPYGFKLTTNWINQVCTYLQINPKKNKEWSSKYSTLEKKYKELNREAEKLCLGIIISEEDVKRTIHPDYSKVSKITIIEQNQPSIPLINFFEDMGFKLKIMIVSSKDKYFDIKEKIENSLNKKENCAISYCKDIDILEEWLNKKEIDAIYSDFIFDKRITGKGKNRLSNDVYFEMGYEGAIRTLERIIRICKSNFNSKYCKFYESTAKPIQIEN